MRVLMVVSNDVVNDSRVMKEARALRDAGHEVAAIGWDRTGRAAASETVDGTEISRVRTRGLLRALGTDVLRNPLWWRQATRMGRRMTFDVVHVHDLDTLPVGVRLKRLAGTPLVYDCHEVFGYMIEEDVPRFVTNASFRMEARLAPQADAVIAVTEPVKAYIDRVSGRPATVVRNVQDPAGASYRPAPPGPFTLLYVGTLHKSRFILPAIETVGAMPDVRLVVAGGKQLADAVRDLCTRFPNTRYLGVVPNERVLPMTLESHAVLSLFDPSHRINQVGVPNKIYEAMAAGRPSITTKGILMGDLVEREACGLAVPYTKEGLRSAIEALRDDPGLAERLGRNGLAAAQREYNWSAESRRLLAVYEGLGGPRTPPRPDASAPKP